MRPVLASSDSVLARVMVFRFCSTTNVVLLEDFAVVAHGRSQGDDFGPGLPLFLA
jgi:hypothetical protein